MAEKSSTWMMAVGAFIAFIGLCFLPADLTLARGSIDLLDQLMNGNAFSITWLDHVW